MSPEKVIRAFMKGAGSILDLSPPVAEPKGPATLESIGEDFQAVGRDLSRAMNAYVIETEPERLRRNEQLELAGISR